MSTARHFTFTGTLAKAWLKSQGWTIQGDLPELPRYIVVAYPHTSNWDFVFMLASKWALDFPVTWIGKESIFRWPFGGLARKLGGLPVVRNHAEGQVAQVAEQMRKAERMVLVMSPEGTRKKSAGWRSGFYHIAREAGVPLVLGYLDYPRKVICFGPLLYPTGDVDADMAKIRAFYAGVTTSGKFPDQAAPVELLPHSKA